LSRVVVHVVCFTDPLCPWSWAAEPVRRRVQVEFCDHVRITYVMAGMSREIAAGEKLASMLDALATSGMPGDPRVWLEGAPRSSYPSCLAVKAASEQGLDEPYLRRLREGAMLRRERLDHVEAFLAAARDVGGMDLPRFEIDLRSNAIVELFGADREQALAACGDRRPSLPSFSVAGGPPIGPAELREAVLAAGARPGELPDPETALRQLGPLAAAEVAEICGLPALRARIELWRLAEQFRARPREHVLGELWEAC
jgi:predicted DsbA family dithiol-disulfide isomerase